MSQNTRDCHHGQLARSCDRCADAREIAELREELERERAAKASAFGLVSSIRFALGDNGRRMQPDLIEWCRGLRAHAQDLAQLRGESTVLRTLLRQADEVLATIDDQDMEDDSQFRQLRQDIAAALDPSSRDSQQMAIAEASRVAP